MASISKLPNGRWRARYRDPARREHARHFDRKIDAQQWLDEVTAATLTGQYVDPRAGRVLFSTYAESWLAARPGRASTRARVRSELDRHILPAIGDMPMSAIRPSRVQAMVTRWPVAPSTARVMFDTVRAIFRAAEHDRVIAASPCTRITLPTAEPSRLTVPTIADVRAISRQLPDELALVPWLGAGLGLRPGEILGLQVERVDFLGRTVSVHRQLDAAGALVELKTRASYRTVPLPDALAVMISAHIAATGTRTEGPLFPGVVRSTFRKTWSAAATRAKRPGMRLHDMRHAYASALIDAGESVKVVQARLGHEKATTTLDTYGHLFPASDERTRQAAQAWLQSATSPQESADSPQDAQS